MSKYNKRITYKEKKLSEFRKFDNEKAKRYGINDCKDEHHPNYIYERKGNNYYYLSMTHKPPKGREKDYVQLERSVDCKDKRKAYINTKSDSADYRAFGARRSGYSFAEKDKKLVNSIIKKNKKRK